MNHLSAVLIALVCVALPNKAVEARQDDQALRSQLDSLNAVRMELEAELERVSVEIGNVEARLQEIRWADLPETLYATAKRGGSVFEQAAPVGRIMEYEAGTRFMAVAEVHNWLHVVRPTEGYVQISSLEMTPELQEWVNRTRESEAERLRLHRAEEFREEVERKRREEQATARKDSLLRARLERAVTEGVPIAITALAFGVNSAGGVEPVISLVNVSSKSIKYVNVTAVPFNSVGDPVRPEYKTLPIQARLVGPIDVGRSATYDFADKPLFYARTTSCIEVRRIDVEFFDGSSAVLIRDLEIARDAGSTKGIVKLEGECAVRR
jgi:hypothetical protein